MIRHSWLVLAALLPTLGIAAADAPKSIAIGSRLELFVHDFLITGSSGEAELVLHSPRVAETVPAFDRPSVRWRSFRREPLLIDADLYSRCFH